MKDLFNLALDSWEIASTLFGLIMFGAFFGAWIAREWLKSYRSQELAMAQKAVTIAEDYQKSATEARKAAEGRLNAAVEKEKAISQAFSDYAGRINSAVTGAVLLKPLQKELHPNALFTTQSKIPIIALANLKGGVGKTTVAANLGAYIADKRDRASNSGPVLRGPKKPVLWIDLDFQGTLSTALLLPSEEDENQNRAEQIFTRPNTPEAHSELAATIPGIGLKDFLVPGCGFLDCDFTAADTEETLLFRWAADKNPKADVRLALKSFLYSPAIQERFRAVILDLPPRNTLFAVSGLVAATDLVIPFKPDAFSTVPLQRFAEFLEGSREALWPDLSIAGLAATMVSGPNVSAAEKPRIERATYFLEKWRGLGPKPKMLGAVPVRASIASAGGDNIAFAYFDNSGGTPKNHDIFLSIGERTVDSLSRRP